MSTAPNNHSLTVAGVVQALESAMAARDPYTVGHQQRVTQIACDIAAGMDLPDHQIEELRIAGRLHDLGKIAIPAEILTKTGQLTEIEFAMIKTHPQVAHDILQPVSLPGQINQIILQHHERLNGSGYPRGLKGKKILLGSRILAVADVLEAMCTHRPYRPALGLEQALAELASNKGILYDEVAVDTCLQLFGNNSQGRRQVLWEPAGRPQKPSGFPGNQVTAVNKGAKPPKPWYSWRRPRFLSPDPRFLLHSAATSAMAAMMMLAARGGL